MKIVLLLLAILGVSMATREYHLRQIQTPYRSTIALHSWLKEQGCFQPGERILDVCCGQGGPTSYLAEQEPQCDFLGIDRDAALIRDAVRKGNLRFETHDITLLPNAYKGKFDGIVGFQVFSWLPTMPIWELATLEPKWIAGSSLFYDGPISMDNRVYDHEAKKEWFYNVYSLPEKRKLFAEYGYDDFRFVPFDIDIDLPQTTKGLGTYTEMTQSGRRLQISGPMLMPWHFILARKT